MINKILIFIILTIICDYGFSQNDTTILNRLNKPIKSCEVIAYNSQEIISNFSINQYDSIYKILTVWEKECGSVEPIQRLKILFDIQFNRFIDTTYNEYIKHNISNFRNRVSDAKDNKYKEIYEFNKAYYYYVPLRSKYDNLTKEFAKILLEKQKKETSEYLFCLLFSEEIDKFDKTVSSQPYFYNYINQTINSDLYNSWTSKFSFNLAAGMWIPIGKLSNNFNPNPHFGFKIGRPILKSFRIDFGINVGPLIKDNNFDLSIDSTIKSVNGKVCLTLGGWIAKEFKITNNYFFDIVGGIGLGRIDTDLKKTKSSSDKNDSYYGIDTYDLSIGVNFRRIVYKKMSIGLNINYHYAPYIRNNLLKTQIGDKFATVSIFFIPQIW